MIDRTIIAVLRTPRPRKYSNTVRRRGSGTTAGAEDEEEARRTTNNNDDDEEENRCQCYIVMYWLSWRQERPKEKTASSFISVFPAVLEREAEEALVMRSARLTRCLLLQPALPNGASLPPSSQPAHEGGNMQSAEVRKWMRPCTALWVWALVGITHCTSCKVALQMLLRFRGHDRNPRRQLRLLGDRRHESCRHERGGHERGKLGGRQRGHQRSGN